MTKQIELTQGKFALVDDEDYDWLVQWNWYYDSGYAMRSAKGCHGTRRPKIRMHREIISVSRELSVDHINGNKLDNRRCNLRACTQSENKRNRGKSKNNTSGYKGVHFYSPKKPWTVSIRVNNKQIFLGNFADPVDAAKAYDRAAIKYHGEFAKLNFPKDE